ncbi:tRNA (guanosine(18)-2'-O)-methyltransferase TrmH [Prochlorococcus marinus]|uniref:tRNA (guanosine(18)-2'-O)-methyltransferase TrmH n=1 Tax=Prochlorococcus marinus TaxID=1219 RepID=UPI0022B593AE|nr:tRNA (guanosine(18)-2'-O)-methyltransferase TrmH [Prochlorococcus marinus]
MPLLPRRFERIKSVLNRRMSNLTLLIEEVEKPHNLSAILRTCDAIGILETHIISKQNKTPTFNNTAQGSQKWVRLKQHKSISEAIKSLKQMGFKLYGTNLQENAKDYRLLDYTKATAFVIGAEKWGLSQEAKELVDESIYIPMRGMVQSLNVSVATAILLSEALKQRDKEGKTPQSGEGLTKDLYKQTLFEWSYPEVANWCKKEGRNYPELGTNGEILESLPRTIKFHC